VKACDIGSPDWWVCCIEIDVSGCTWATTPVLGDPNVTAFLKVLSLHRFCSTCTPTTCQLHVAENSFTPTTYLAIQGQFFSELECRLSSDMARMSHFCRQRRLKPSAPKTMSSVFHLHNTSATCELSVYPDGQRFRHECYPTYLGVTLDCTLSYREHLTRLHAS